MLLLITLSSQNLVADISSSTVSVRRGTIAQLQDTLKRYHKVLKSYAKCVATGECESEHQKIIAADIRDLIKKLVQLLAVAGMAGVGFCLVRRKILNDAKILKQELKAELQNQKADIEARIDAAIDRYKPVVDDSVKEAIKESIDYAKSTATAVIKETIDKSAERIEEARSRLDITMPSVHRGGKLQINMLPKSTNPNLNPAAAAAVPGANVAANDIAEANANVAQNTARKQGWGEWASSWVPSLPAEPVDDLMAYDDFVNANKKKK